MKVTITLSERDVRIARRLISWGLVKIREREDVVLQPFRSGQTDEYPALPYPQVREFEDVTSDLLKQITLAEMAQQKATEGGNTGT